jgi:hypothetical protein
LGILRSMPLPPNSSAILKLDPSMPRGLVEVTRDDLVLWFRHSPQRARRLFAMAVLVLVAVVELGMILGGFHSGPGLNGFYLRAGLYTLVLVPLVVLFSPRQTKFERGALTATTATYLLGLVPAVRKTVSLDQYITIIVSRDSTWSNRISSWTLGTPQAEIILVGDAENFQVRLISGPRESVIQLAQFMVLRRPEFNLRIEC